MKAEFDFERGRSIIWLASYPKSGNTWLRALLTAFLQPGSPLDLNALVGKGRFLDRQLLDDMAGIDSAQLSPRDLIPYQAMQIRAFAASAQEALYCKTHSKYLTGAGGCALFPTDATAGAIYIVRNPADIVPSYAHHEGKDFDTIITMMADDTAALDYWAGRRSPNVPQLVGSWSGNVASWVDQAPFPVLLVRYEDLLDKPDGMLESILEFLRMPHTPERVTQAVETACFESLAKAERQTGFSEKPSLARSFFREGRSGGGAKLLNTAQLRKLLRACEFEMTRQGYHIAPAGPERTLQ